MIDEHAQIRRIAVKRPEKLTEAGIVATEAMLSGALDSYSVENGAQGILFVVSSRNWSVASEAADQALNRLIG